MAEQISFTALMFAIDTGCPPPVLFATVIITGGIRSGPTRSINCVSRPVIHVAFERMLPRRFERLRYGQVHCLGSRELAVWSRGIEMHVVRDDVALLAHDAEENVLGRPSLVRWNDRLKTRDRLNRLRKTPKTR